MEFINYAHRGASEYAPENTFPSFYLGCRMGANGVETDVQRTKDGILVLFHDNDLMRICSIPEAVSDLTKAQLDNLDFGIYKGEEFTNTAIPTLEAFLSEFASHYRHFAIEIKERGVEKSTVAMIRKYLTNNDVVITSGIWSSLIETGRIAPEIKRGYLAKYLSLDLVEKAKSEGIWQICPKASILTKEWNKTLREMGFSVRAWGIDSIDTMERMVDMGVDGMTVNFPDKLCAYLKNRG